MLSYHTPEVPHGTRKSAPGKGDSFWKPSLIARFHVKLEGCSFLRQCRSCLLDCRPWNSGSASIDSIVR